MPDQELTQEEKIELIRWGCKYADGYNLAVTSPIGKARVTNPSNEWPEMQYFPNHYLYCDFLQQLIEGINKNSIARISQGCDDILVDGACINTMFFSFLDYSSVIQAKESALKYIMDQEAINGT